MYSTAVPSSRCPKIPPSPPNHLPPLLSGAQGLYPCANTYYYVQYYRIWFSSVQHYPLLFLLLHQPPPFLRVVKEYTLVLTHTTMYSTTGSSSVRSHSTPFYFSTSSPNPPPPLFLRVVKDYILVLTLAEYCQMSTHVPGFQ